MHLAANLSIVFSRLPFTERFRAASAAGFHDVEFWWPRAEVDAGMTDTDLLAPALQAEVRVALLNFDGGVLPSGDRGLAGDPTRVAEFRANVPRAIAVAARLGCPKLNALAGKQVAGYSPAAQGTLLRDSLAYAAGVAAEIGKTVVVEPLNPAENPGYLLPSIESALAVIDDVGAPNLKLQLDIYHVARMGDDPIDVIRRAGDYIGHVQIADSPGRHEPGTGNLDFVAIFDALGAAGYNDTVGLEYTPIRPESPSFDYLAGLRALIRADDAGTAG